MYKPLAKKESKFNLIFFSALMSLTLSSLLYSGNISTICPLFGIANQTLAGIAFAIGTSVLIDMGKDNYFIYGTVDNFVFYTKLSIVPNIPTFLFILLYFPML